MLLELPSKNILVIIHCCEYYLVDHCLVEHCLNIPLHSQCETAGETEYWLTWKILARRWSGDVGLWL